MRYGNPRVDLPLPEQIDLDGYRVCTECGEKKLLEKFSPDSRCRGGRKRICTRCTSKKTIAWHHANKERSLKAQRLARVRRIHGEDGLAVEERRRRGDPCDICGGHTARMAIDHDHETGKVRGMLCKDCNWVLGWVHDDPARLRAMADYLDKA